MPINFLLLVLIGFSAGIISLVLLKNFASSRNVFTIKGIPAIGGISMGLAFLITCLFVPFLFKNLPQGVIGIIISSLIMLAFGIIDDWRELNVSSKFFVQMIATSILIFSGVKTEVAYIGSLINIIVTFAWVLGITNAFNLLDIMDGLAAGIAIIACFAFLVISLLNGDIPTLILTVSLTGIILSFLIYNLPPAKIYMGNSGSHFLGFILAAVALRISYASLSTKIALVSPLLILGFPILDTLFLILMRISKKRLPFNKTNDHLAMRLLALGYSKKKVLSTILILGMFFSFSGVAVSRLASPLGAAIVIIVILVSFVFANKMSKVEIHG